MLGCCAEPAAAMHGAPATLRCPSLRTHVAAAVLGAEMGKDMGRSKACQRRIHPCRARNSDPAAALPRTVRCFSASWSWCEMLSQARGRSALRARPWRKCAAWVRGSHLCMALAQGRIQARLVLQVHCVPSFLTSGRPLQYHPAAGPMHPCRNPRQSTAAVLVHHVPSQQPR